MKRKNKQQFKTVADIISHTQLGMRKQTERNRTCEQSQTKVQEGEYAIITKKIRNNHKTSAIYYKDTSVFHMHVYEVQTQIAMTFFACTSRALESIYTKQYIQVLLSPILSK